MSDDTAACRWPTAADLVQMPARQRARWLRDELLWYLGLGSAGYMLALAAEWAMRHI